MDENRWEGYTEVVAKIKDVHFGCRDVDTPVLWFTTELILEGGAALQVLGRFDGGLETWAFLRKRQCYDITQLAGTPVRVMVDEHQKTIVVSPHEFDWGYFTEEDKSSFHQCLIGRAKLIAEPEERRWEE